MSDNAKFVQDLYAAFGRGDIGFILGALDEQAELICYGPPSVPFAGTFIGPANVAKFFEVLGTTQTNQNLKIEETHVSGDQVISIGRYSGSVISTGKTFDSKVAHIFTIRNGKVVRLLDFIDTAHAVEAYTATA